MQTRGFAASLLGCLILGGAALAQPNVPAPSEPAAPLKGKLVMVGGGKMPDSVIQAFIKLAGGKEAKLVVISTASATADKEMPDATIALWTLRGAGSVRVLHTRVKEKADEAEFVKPLSDATAVWLGGGDQSKLTAAYKGTLVEKELHALLQRGGVIGGTSAGAAVMSRLMIARGQETPEFGEGFGFFPGGIVDQHFLKRNRIDRLFVALQQHPGWFGLGIDEETAAVVEGQTVTIVGNSAALILQRATPDHPPSCRIIPAGSQADLAAWSKSALERRPKSK